MKWTRSAWVACESRTVAEAKEGGEQRACGTDEGAVKDRPPSHSTDPALCPVCTTRNYIDPLLAVNVPVSPLHQQACERVGGVVAVGNT